MLVLLTALTLTATDECLQCAIPDLCPEGYACSDTFQGSSNYSACPAGFSCPAGSLSPQRCSSVATAFPLPWCMQNLCEEESGSAILCPAGYYCPDVTRKVKCPTLTSSPLTPTHPNLPP